MNRIEQAFNRRREAGGAAMIFYLTAGYPTLDATERAIDALAAAGADVIELGIPFSDPVADGPTIQAASTAALAGGLRVRSIFELAARVRRRHPNLALVLFGAYNPVLAMGEESFIELAAGAGVDGLLLPDLPPEAATELRAAAGRAGLSIIFLVAPTTTPERARLIAEASTGFIYYVSVRGVTGARSELPADLEPTVLRLKQLTDKPVAVGFGVSTPVQARAIAGFADGIIVGSELVRLIGEHAAAPDFEERVQRWARALVTAVSPAPAADGPV